MPSRPGLDADDGPLNDESPVPEDEAFGAVAGAGVEPATFRFSGRALADVGLITRRVVDP
jgi:hypothetical protein